MDNIIRTPRGIITVIIILICLLAQLLSGDESVVMFNILHAYAGGITKISFLAVLAIWIPWNKLPSASILPIGLICSFIAYKMLVPITFSSMPNKIEGDIRFLNIPLIEEEAYVHFNVPALLEADADIISFSHVNIDFTIDILRLLKETYPHQAVAIDQRYGDMALVSRFPLKLDFELPNGGNSYLARLPSGDVIRIIQINTPPLSDGVFSRESLFTVLSNRAWDNKSTFVVGDFNTPASSKLLTPVLESIGLNLPEDTYPTHPLGIPMANLNYILTPIGLPVSGNFVFYLAGASQFVAGADVTMTAP